MPFQFQVMNTRFFQTNYLKRQRGWKRSPLFHAKEMYSEFEDKIWVEDMSLNLLCLTASGLRDMYKEKDFVKTGYRDILSIPLSGASDTTLEPDSKITYKSSKARQSAQEIILPIRV